MGEVISGIAPVISWIISPVTDLDVPSPKPAKTAFLPAASTPGPSGMEGADLPEGRGGLNMTQRPLTRGSAAVGNLGIVVGILAFGGCGMATNDGDDDADLAMRPEALVTGGRSVTLLTGARARETATVVNGATGHKVVTYNFTDPAHVSSSGAVTRGASEMGWSWSAGPNINDAFEAPQRMAPPTATNCQGNVFNPDPCWPILWGDPGLGEVPGTSRMFLTNLAAPDRKMPTSGEVPDLTQVLGGACIARSSDGGQTFTLSSVDCVHDADYSFYDGSDVTGTVDGGPVFAAFRNVAKNTIDVFMAATPTSLFTQLPDPFPGLLMGDQPRLRAMGGTVFLMASDADHTLWLQEYSGGWGNISAGWPKGIATDYAYSPFLQASVTIGTASLRLTAEYDLSATGRFGTDPLVVVVYAAQAASHAILKERDCHPFSPVQDACAAGATIDPGVNVFHPALAVANITIPGSGGAFSQVWQAAWSQQNGTASAPGSQVAIYSGLLGGGAATLTGRRETGFQTPCPTGGAWGDYNTHVGFYQPTSTANPLFWTAFTDSTDATGASTCDSSTPMNISATWIDYPGTKFDDGEFFDQNYNFSGADWDPPTGNLAYFKGQCSPDFRQLGLSKSPSSGRTFALLCQMATDPSPFPGTYAATLAVPGDQRRASRSGDWDYGFYKLECGGNEYVSGSSQNFTTRQFHGIRCAHSGRTLRNFGCYRRLFDSSGAAGDGDWSFGYYKAECGPGEYMAGVSVDTTASDPHAVLCCPI
jgi:hypothetical protein